MHVLFQHPAKTTEVFIHALSCTNGWSNMVEEELLPPTAGMTINGWSMSNAMSTSRYGLLPMMMSHSCHSWYNCLAVRSCMYKRQTAGELAA